MKYRLVLKEDTEDIRSEEFSYPGDLSDVGLIRQIKKWAGLTQVRCRKRATPTGIIVSPYSTPKTVVELEFLDDAGN